jgi:hypothetical protein
MKIAGNLGRAGRYKLGIAMTYDKVAIQSLETPSGEMLSLIPDRIVPGPANRDAKQ